MAKKNPVASHNHRYPVGVTIHLNPVPRVKHKTGSPAWVRDASWALAMEVPDSQASRSTPSVERPPFDGLSNLGDLEAQANELAKAITRALQVEGGRSKYAIPSFHRVTLTRNTAGGVGLAFVFWHLYEERVPSASDPLARLEFVEELERQIRTVSEVDEVYVQNL